LEEEEGGVYPLNIDIYTDADFIVREVDAKQNNDNDMGTDAISVNNNKCKSPGSWFKSQVDHPLR
jgi:hypothetical protein